jgi:nitrate/nitrite transporter NarK
VPAAACLVAGNMFFMFYPIAAFSTCVDIGGNYSGTVAGIMNCSGQTGAFFLAIIFGKMVDSTHDFNAPLFVISGVLLLGAFVWLAIEPTKQIVTEQGFPGPEFVSAGIAIKE